MKALVLRENARLEYAEHPLVEVDGWYRVRIAFAGVCGSDLGRGFKNGAYHYPLVMGHEFSGVIDAAPAGGAFAAGDRVAVYPLLPCGACASCRRGKVQQCEHYDYFGSRRDGAFAEYLYAPEANLLRVPDGVSLEEAAMCEPAAVARHAVFAHPVAPGAAALVIGAGPIGLIAAQWLRVRGCVRVALADVDAEKLAFARRLGFEAVDSRALPDGAAFDVCVEACGLGITRTLAVRCAARSGHVCFIGNPADDWTLARPDFSAALRKELTFSCSWNSLARPDWEEVLAHIGKGLDLRALVTDRVPLSGGAALFDALLRRDGFHCKSLLEVR